MDGWVAQGRARRLKISQRWLRARIDLAMRVFRVWFARRPRTPIELLAFRPLHGGAALYVADVDERRFVFVTGTNAACLLATYPVGERPSAREEAASGGV